MGKSLLGVILIVLLVGLGVANIVRPSFAPRQED
jgi:hypothetical protein